MTQIDITSRFGDYPIMIDSGLLTDLHNILESHHHGQKWVVLTHAEIWDHYGKPISDVLEKIGIHPVIIQVPVGEESKSLTRVERVVSSMMDHHCDRSTWLITLGGGVIGDLGGFVASVFMRGISYLQIPTTLLAMVDSSVGGKTGVNTPQGKNLIGAFYPPKIVLTDPTFLKTLPVRQVFSAAAEILKTAAISDSVFFQEFSLQLSDYQKNPSSVHFSKAIISACRFKAQIVSQDEQESGIRRILNFGHTVGHALETFYGHEHLTHGESIAYGMLCAGYISYRFGKKSGLSIDLSTTDWEALKEAICKLPLPPLDNLNIDSVLSIMKRDKKNVMGMGNFVLLEALGKPVISHQVTDDYIKISLEQL
ncbi:MAG: 3-dehydroquinate synthase [Candidatus Marinimicrobia bacterium]|nr:3-dehydroquinate synthase [Candidatus Neomarinimicrobiota bacterium]